MLCAKRAHLASRRPRVHELLLLRKDALIVLQRCCELLDLGLAAGHVR